MRNLKRVLSLALAAMMLLGMMVISSSAAEITKADFSDMDEITYQEAVEVMVALNVIDGMDDGTFDPDGILTREQAAKLLCHMLLGPENAEKLSTNESIFTDVRAGWWSAGYIAYCYRVGILAGMGDGTFNPAGELTGVAFGKMLLVALGYDPTIQEYTGDNWAISVGKDMIEAGIDVSGTTLTAPLTREQAAQMAFQALEANMVTYTFTLQGYITGVQTPVEVEDKASLDYDSNDDKVLQFCEKYFPDLTKTPDTIDDFGRPVTEWVLDGDSIGTYANKAPVVTYTTKQTAADVAKDLRGYKVADTQNSTQVAINGNGAADSTNDSLLHANGLAAAALAFNNITPAAAIAGETGNGKVVEIYANNKKVITSIVTLTYGVDKITSVVESRDGDYRKTVYTTTNNVNGTVFTDPDKDDTAVVHANLERDDIVMTLELGSGVTHYYLAEQVIGAQTSYNSGKETITVGGTTYTVATGVNSSKYVTGTKIDFTDFNSNSRDESTIYLDLYGNVVKKDAVASRDYAVIDAIRWTQNTTDLDANGSATARLIFADGTTETVTLDKLKNGIANEQFENEDPANGASLSAASGTTHKLSTDVDTNKSVYAGLIVTYTKANSGKYNVTVENTKIGGSNVATGTAADKVVTKGVPALQDGSISAISDITGNNDTVYIVKSKSGSNTNYNAYTGYQNVPTITMGTGNSARISYVADTGTVAKYIFIDATAGSTVGEKKSGDIVYIFDENNFRVEGTGSDAKYVYADVVFNGEMRDELEANSVSIFTAPGLYEVELNDKGVVTGVSGDPAYVGDNVDGDAAKGVLKTDGASYTYNDSETVYVIDVDEETVYVGGAESAQDDDVIYVKTKSTSGASANRYAIDVAYVIKGGSAIVTKTAATATSSTISSVGASQSLTIAGYTVTTASGDDSLEKELTTWVSAWNTNRKNATLWEASIHGDKDKVVFTFTVPGALASTTGDVASAIGGLTVTNGTASDGSTITYTAATAATAASGTVAAANNASGDADLTIFGIAVSQPDQSSGSGTATAIDAQLTVWLAGWEAKTELDDNWSAAKNNDSDGIDLTYKTTGALSGSALTAAQSLTGFQNGTNATATTSP